MFPEQYTFQAPLQIPVKAGASGFINIIRGPDGFPAIIATPVDHCPEVVRKTTDERGRLVRAITNDFQDLPQFGKITLTVEYLIKTEALI